RTFSKDEIFQMYLNRINFGEGAYGAQAAAQTFLGKNVDQIDLAEAALLAGLPNAPSKWSPYRNAEVAEQRRQAVLNQMAKFGYINPEEAEKAKQHPPKLIERTKRAGITGANAYPYFVDHVIEECIEKYGISENLLYKGGLEIYTTVDPKAQKAAETALTDPNNYPKSRDNVPVQAAIAVVDHSSGQVRALVGGREYTALRGFNRATNLKRQPGSAFKPIAAYGPALENGKTPATVLDDVPVSYGAYAPKNYDGTYRGLISLREATRLSVNIYAVKLLNEIGIQTGFSFAKKLGIDTLDEKRDKVLGLALGGLSQGTSPLAMAGAYGAFGNKGIWIEPHAVLKVLDRDGKPYVEVKPKQQAVMKATTAFLMTDILETVVKSGTGTKAQMDRPVAGKTGTTELPQDLPQFRGLKGNKDAWFAGYTPELAAVVWMGYDDTDKSHYLYQAYGGGYPAQIWRQVMVKALQGVKSKGFSRPGGIVEATIDTKSGLLPSPLTPTKFIRTELFDETTVPKEISPVWAEVEVCADTGKRHQPGDGCSKVVKNIVLQRPVPCPEGVKPQDADLEAPFPKEPGSTPETKPDSQDPGSSKDPTQNKPENKQDKDPGKKPGSDTPGEPVTPGPGPDDNPTPGVPPALKPGGIDPTKPQG
ncbi:MAG: penicillin-binding transpeptidase domain-containing protein, partial [Heliobacteriaceae bacterium]|nr:penicillin-binding transpeptidase domain-containing protein [Heliobacteriaceae bacterium]